jgi:hypothetical protein
VCACTRACLSHTADGSDKYQSDPCSPWRGGPFSKHVKVLERTKVWSQVLTGLKTKNYCAGNGQQQFNRLTKVRQCKGEWMLSLSESQQGQSSVEGKLLALVKPLFSSKRFPHFKTRKRLSIYGSAALCWTLAAFQFLGHSDGRGPWTGYQPVATPLPTHRIAQTE